jgi:flagellar export protein FliJ
VATRFRFRLESLLKLRHSLEQAAQRTLARALADLDQARLRLAQLRQARDGAVEARRTPPRQPVDLDLWRAVERYLVVLDRRITQAGSQVRAAEEQVAAARQALIRAHQAHLMLLRLKERRQEQHDLEESRAEHREMDEVAVLRYRLGPALPGAAAREMNP